MTFNIDLIQKYYQDLPGEIDKLRKLTKRPLTFTEKILFTHLSGYYKEFQRGRDYVEFNPYADVDDGSCQTLKIFGCLDSTMFN